MSKRARDESEGAASSDAQEPPAAKAGHTASAANLTRLPSAAMYEQSFMHRDHVSHTLVTSSDVLVTCSRDGQLKFWKKMQKGIEFVKHFRAHLTPIAATGVHQRAGVIKDAAPLVSRQRCRRHQKTAWAYVRERDEEQRGVGLNQPVVAVPDERRLDPCQGCDAAGRREEQPQ